MAPERKTNLVFIKTKASSIDLSPTVIREREQLLQLAFQDSKWINLTEEPFKLLVILEEIRVRREHLYEEGDEPDEDNTTLNTFDEQISDLREELQKNRDDWTVDTAAMDGRKR
uniref:Kinesin-like protein KIF3A n=1 Tax=Caenorhabditis tropicalis TaxID=1561998 RepID=A0A1I7UHL8_9PELO